MMKLCMLKNSRLLISEMATVFSNPSLKIPKYIFCEKLGVFFTYNLCELRVKLFESVNVVVTVVFCVLCNL